MFKSIPELEKTIYQDYKYCKGCGYKSKVSILRCRGCSQSRFRNKRKLRGK